MNAMLKDIFYLGVDYLKTKKITDEYINWICLANAGMLHKGNIYCMNLVSCQPCNVAIDMLYYLHNQPRRIEYEEIHCDT